MERGYFSNFQMLVGMWAVEIFGEAIARNKQTRNYRFFEEATELVQSLGMTRDECITILNYVFGRPVGEPPQELGGVGVTLAALAVASGLNADACFWDELERCNRPEVMEKIRAKQKNKPNPLGVLPALEAQGLIEPRSSLLTNTPPEPLYWWPTGATVQFYDKVGVTHIKLEMPKHEFNNWVLGQREMAGKARITELPPGYTPDNVVVELGCVVHGSAHPCEECAEEVASPAFHMNSTGDVAVADDYFTRDDMENCPKNTKVYLVGAGGVGTLAHYDGDPFWVEWAPLPKRKGSK